MTPPDSLKLPPMAGAAPWIKLDRWPQRPQEFSFALLSDRTGFPRPGVFERAVRAATLLRPDFVVQIGDAIEGYTRDPAQLAAEWAEFDAITDALDLPLFRVPGNHDVSNEVMREDWLRRFGALHYHFRHQDVLFLVLDTQDPPQHSSDFGGLDAKPGQQELDIDALKRLLDTDPRAFAQHVEQAVDVDARQPAHLSEAQCDWAVRMIREHADVRWTFLLMHIPAWLGELHPGFARIRAALDGRPYTAFGGHLHNYQRRVIDGCDHIRLGPCGGAWVTTREDGNFDHLCWVSMGAREPRIANLVLDGVLGVDEPAFRPRAPFT